MELLEIMDVRKGTYRNIVKDDEGKYRVSEKGFTFIEESGQELSFDIHEHSTGMAVLFGNQIFFLGFWTDEQLDKASTTFNEAINREKQRRINNDLRPKS